MASHKLGTYTVALCRNKKNARPLFAKVDWQNNKNNINESDPEILV
jgi:hypothetical protein